MTDTKYVDLTRTTAVCCSKQYRAVVGTNHTTIDGINQHLNQKTNKSIGHQSINQSVYSHKFISEGVKSYILRTCPQMKDRIVVRKRRRKSKCFSQSQKTFKNRKKHPQLTSTCQSISAQVRGVRTTYLLFADMYNNYIYNTFLHPFQSSHKKKYICVIMNSLSL